MSRRVRVHLTPRLTPRLTLRRALAFVLVLGGLALVPLASAPSSVAAGNAWSQTKTLTRHYFTGDHSSGYTPAQDQRTVTVSVDKHTDLQTRERIHVTWKGAHPSGGRTANPFGEKGLAQEYPVLLLECRGLDDPSLPADQQLKPSTCWTSTYFQRSASQSVDQAIWLQDAENTDADRARISGIDPSKVPSNCPLGDTTAYHITPFLAADGTFYAGCSADNMPPQAAVDSVDPPNETAAFTALDGTGSADFEVRTDIENEALGCSDTVPCSLVVIPINGVSCDQGGGFCNSTGNFDPGSNNTGGVDAAQAVSPSLWWSPSNWSNRFSVPLDFAPPPDTCLLLGSGAPVPFYGSELLSQAALQWAPAYCLNKSRFNWQANTMPDDAAFSLMQNGGALAAEVSGPRSLDKVGYAPTAVSGFGIAYVVDKPGNAGQQTTLRLNARLLAKLLTESYPGSPFGAKRPGLEKNPYSINLDPEFQQLNPGLDATHFSEAASTLLALNTGSDVISQLTAYLQADPDARAFLDGEADPWGMKVNPAYKKIQLPLDTWPLLDTWYPKNTGQGCLDTNPAPYLPKVAAPVSSMRLIATAMLLNWPNVNTACDYDPTADLYKLGRIQQQGVGNRFMLGLVTLGDAERYGLQVASLQAAPDRFVAPNAAGLSAGVALAEQPRTSTTSRTMEKARKGTKGKKSSPAPSLAPYVLDQDKVRESNSAYPGTMIVYTAAKTSGLSKSDAATVGQFMQVSTTEGQRPGRGNGQLPAGYLPIVDKGATAKLYATANAVRAAVLAQKAPASPSSPTTPTASPTPTTTVPSGAPVPVTAPVTGDVPPAVVPPTSTPAPTASSPEATQTVATAPLSSSLGGGLLPFLLLTGLAAALVSTIARIALRMRGVR